jgi:multiple sugar transport system ATP-binding protein
MTCAGKQMFFRIGKERSYAVGERIALSVNRRRMHLFDAKNGISLRGQP